MNQKGFALVESLATLTFAAAALTGGAGLSYAAFARMYLKHASYEFTVCLASTATYVDCKNAFQNRVAEALPIGELHHVIGTRDRTKNSVSGYFEIPGGLKIPLDESRDIPGARGATADELKRRFP